MDTNKKPYIWEIIKEAAVSFTGEFSLEDVIAYVLERRPQTKHHEIKANAKVLTVNCFERFKIPGAKQERITGDDGVNVDVLFEVATQKYVLYDKKNMDNGRSPRIGMGITTLIP